MTDESDAGRVRSNDLLGHGNEVADAARVLAWAREKPRRPATSAFTAGPERQAAYWIEWAEAAERERCAKLCEERFSDGALVIADAIRALGKA